MGACYWTIGPGRGPYRGGQQVAFVQFVHEHQGGVRRRQQFSQDLSASDWPILRCLGDALRMTSLRLSQVILCRLGSAVRRGQAQGLVYLYDNFRKSLFSRGNDSSTLCFVDCMKGITPRTADSTRTTGPCTLTLRVRFLIDWFV